MPKIRRIAAAGSRRLRQDRLDPCAAPRRAGPHRTALWAIIIIIIIITTYAYACTFECSAYELDWLHARSFNGGDAMLGASASDLINQSPHGLLVPPEGHQNPHLRTLGLFDSLEFNFEAQFRLETRGLVQGPDL